MARTPTSITALARVLGASERPVYLLDEQRRIVYCNAACAAWVGQSADTLVGQTCAYHSQPAEADEAAACELCPPPEAFLGMQSTAIITHVLPEGRGSVRRSGDFWPLGNATDGAAIVLAILAADDQQTAEPAFHDPSSHDGSDLHQSLQMLRAQFSARYGFDRLVGVSPESSQARAQAELAAKAAQSVLIVGPCGTGKRHLAKAIHYRRVGVSDLAILSLDCAALPPDSLISSVALWLARNQARMAEAKGENSHPETLHLENADRLPGEAQFEVARLLRSAPTRSLVVATAERPLSPLVSAETYRADLAAWLSTLVIELLPLAKRLADIPLLAQLLLEDVNASSARQIAGFAPDALDRLVAYPWPGNLDELAEVIRQAHERASGAQIALRDLPKQIHLAAEAAGRPRKAEEPIDLEAFLQSVERELIDRVLARSKGNKSKAARLLGLTRPRLYRRMVQLGFESEMFKPE